MVVSLPSSFVLKIVARSRAAWQGFQGVQAAARKILDDVLNGEAVRALRGALRHSLAGRGSSCEESGGLGRHLSLAGVHSLQSSSCKRSDSYHGELCLNHPEARVKVTAWLARVLSECKRALLRGGGSNNQATELKFQDIAHSAELLEGKTPLALSWPFRSSTERLRELEVLGAKLARFVPSCRNRTEVSCCRVEATVSLRRRR